MCGSDFDDELAAWQDPQGCRYIVGHPHTDNWFYCQKKIQKGGSLGNAVMPPYCDEHAELCASPTHRMSRDVLARLCSLDSNVRAFTKRDDTTEAVDDFLRRAFSEPAQPQVTRLPSLPVTPPTTAPAYTMSPLTGLLSAATKANFLAAEKQRQERKFSSD